MGNGFTRRLVLSGLVALGLASLTFVACKTPNIKAKAEGEIPTWNGPIIFKGSISTGEGDFQSQNATRDCYEVKFFDAQGNVTGTVVIKPGANSGKIPAGTVEWAAGRVPCPPPANGGGHSVGLDDTLALADSGDHIDELRSGPGVPVKLFDIPVFGGPLFIDRASATHNATYSFVVRCTDVTTALAIARNAIDDPIGAPIDPSITVVTYLKMRENGVSASVLAFARQPFTRFEIDVNDKADYATLTSGAVQTQSPGGVYVVDAPVSMLDIHGYDEWNHLDVRSEYAGGARTVETTVSMLHAH